MSFYSKGIEGVTQRPANTNATPKSDNRFYLKAGEQARLVVVSQSLSELISFYEYSVFTPDKDKRAFNLRVTSPSQGDRPDPTTDPIAQRQLFNEFIKRQFVLLVEVIDCRSFEVKGQNWTHTRKTWALKGSAISQFLQEAKSDTCGGRVFGGIFDVSRHGSQGASCGNHIAFRGHAKKEFFLNSPRVRWKQEWEWKTNQKKMSPEEAARSYFFSYPDPDEYYAPTPERVNHFIAFLDMKFGGGNSSGSGNAYNPQTATSNDPLSSLDVPAMGSFNDPLTGSETPNQIQYHQDIPDAVFAPNKGSEIMTYPNAPQDSSENSDWPELTTPEKGKQVESDLVPWLSKGESKGEDTVFSSVSDDFGMVTEVSGDELENREVAEKTPEEEPNKQPKKQSKNDPKNKAKKSSGKGTPPPVTAADFDAFGD